MTGQRFHCDNSNVCYYVQVIRDTKIITDRVGRIKLLDAVLVYFVTKLGTRGKKLNFNERIILAKGGSPLKFMKIIRGEIGVNLKKANDTSLRDSLCTFAKQINRAEREREFDISTEYRILGRE